MPSSLLFVFHFFFLSYLCLTSCIIFMCKDLQNCFDSKAETILHTILISFYHLVCSELLPILVIINLFFVCLSKGWERFVHVLLCTRRFFFSYFVFMWIICCCFSFIIQYFISICSVCRVHTFKMWICMQCTSTMPTKKKKRRHTPLMTHRYI